MQEWERNVTKGHKENLRGNGYVHKFDCDGSFTNVNI